uniref:Uncharacterized protein n=8 Tax=unclassified Caudoviricetes TaxID=2788787 RepID=A0AB39U1X5_9CAUD
MARALSMTNPTSALQMVDDDDKQVISRSDTLNFPEGIAPQVQAQQYRIGTPGGEPARFP